MKLTRNERGFTLIELMVVLIIIGVLAAIAIPTLSKQTDKAKIKRAVSELKSMKTIVDIQMNDPAVNSSGNAPVKTAESNEIGNLLKNNGITSVADPWGTAYQYAYSGKTYSIYTVGNSATDKDGIEVTEGSGPAENMTETDLPTNEGTAAALTLP